jgi:predicted RNA-binding Zn ribbon-like protein
MSAPAPFELVAGHPALDFVNTLDDQYAASGPVELLPTYEAFLRFSVQNGLLTPAQGNRLRRQVDRAAAARALEAARTLRGALGRIFDTVVAGDPPRAEHLAILNDAVAAAFAHRKVERRAGDYGWNWHGMETDPAAPLWPIALAAAELLVSAEAARVRHCKSETCRWLFLDTSKNGSRKWCDMKICGNRVKARAYYRRQLRSRRRTAPANP